MKSTKKDNFSIRKLTVGTASVFLGATVTPIIFDLPSTIVNEAKANEVITAPAPTTEQNNNNNETVLGDSETTEYVVDNSSTNKIESDMNSKNNASPSENYDVNTEEKSPNNSTTNIESLSPTLDKNSYSSREASNSTDENTIYDFNKSSLINKLESLRNYYIYIPDYVNNEKNRELINKIQIENVENPRLVETAEEVLRSNKFSPQQVKELEDLIENKLNIISYLRAELKSAIENSELQKEKNLALNEINTEIKKYNNLFNNLEFIKQDEPIVEEQSHINGDSTGSITEYKNSILLGLKKLDILSNQLQAINEIYKKYNEIGQKYGLEIDYYHYSKYGFNRAEGNNSYYPDYPAKTYERNNTLTYYEPDNKYKIRTLLKKTIKNNIGDTSNLLDIENIKNTVITNLDSVDARLKDVHSLSTDIKDIVDIYNNIPNEIRTYESTYFADIILRQHSRKIDNIENIVYNSDTPIDQTELEKIIKEAKLTGEKIKKFIVDFNKKDANLLYSYINGSVGIGSYVIANDDIYKIIRDKNSKITTENFVEYENLNTRFEELVNYAKEIDSIYDIFSSIYHSPVKTEEINNIRNYAITKVLNPETNLAILEDEIRRTIDEIKLKYLKSESLQYIDKIILDTKKYINYNFINTDLIEKQKIKFPIDKLLAKEKELINNSTLENINLNKDLAANRLYKNRLETIKNYLEDEIKKVPNLTNKTSESIEYYNSTLLEAKNSLEKLMNEIALTNEKELEIIEDYNQQNVKENDSSTVPTKKELPKVRTGLPTYIDDFVIDSALESKIVLETAKLMLEENTNTTNSNTEINNATNGTENNKSESSTPLTNDDQNNSKITSKTEPEKITVPKEEVIEETIPFNTIIKEDSTLPLGTEIVDIEGVPGLVYKVTIGSDTTIIPKVEKVDKVIRKGTNKISAPVNHNVNNTNNNNNNIPNGYSSQSENNSIKEQLIPNNTATLSTATTNNINKEKNKETSLPNTGITNNNLTLLGVTTLITAGILSRRKIPNKKQTKY